MKSKSVSCPFFRLLSSYIYFTEFRRLRLRGMANFRSYLGQAADIGG